MDEIIITVPELALLLKLSNRQVYAMIQHKKLPSVRTGRIVRVRENALRKWIEKNSVWSD